MPIYTYKCPTCKEVIERKSTIAECRNQICEICLEPLDKLIDKIGTIIIK